MSEIIEGGLLDSLFSGVMYVGGNLALFHLVRVTFTSLFVKWARSTVEMFCKGILKSTYID